MILSPPPPCSSTGPCARINCICRSLALCLQRFRERRLTPYLSFKVRELHTRRATEGPSVFNLEPNLKTSAGCLRDIQFLRNLAFMLFGARTLARPARTRHHRRRRCAECIFAANDHLLGLRTPQHFHHGHRQDQFLLADQLRCAQQLGWGAQQSLREVEILMRHHYRKMTMVDQVVQLCLHRLHALGHLPWAGAPRPSAQTFGRGLYCHRSFCVFRGRIPPFRRRLLPSHIYHGPRAQDNDLRLSINLQRRLKSLITTQAIVDRHDPEATDAVHGAHGAGGRVAPILRDLHGAGFLGAYLPEFGRITCHMQFDAYHHYTVDEHTLIAIDYLDKVALCDDEMPPVLQQVNSTVVRHDLLSLGLLMHDVGKYMGRGHIPRGELMMGMVSKRLGLSDADDDVLRFLVREHVTLSNASRKVDLTDSVQMEKLAKRIGSVERLDLLYCLTWPDAKAVGPKIFTGWQESILEECYLSLRQYLSGRIKPLATRREQLMAALGEQRQVSVPEAQAYLETLPADYPYQVPDVDLALWHFDLLATMRGKQGESTAGVKPFGDLWVMALVLPDRANLLADVAAVCAGNGLDIHGCRVWVTKDGFALQSVHLAGVLPAKWKDNPAGNCYSRNICCPWPPSRLTNSVGWIVAGR